MVTFGLELVQLVNVVSILLPLVFFREVSLTVMTFFNWEILILFLLHYPTPSLLCFRPFEL